MTDKTIFRVGAAFAHEGAINPEAVRAALPELPLGPDTDSIIVEAMRLLRWLHEGRLARYNDVIGPRLIHHDWKNDLRTGQVEPLPLKREADRKHLDRWQGTFYHGPRGTTFRRLLELMLTAGLLTAEG
jgi:hypothetical protein